MLGVKELALLACVIGMTSVIAIAAWWHDARYRWAALCVLLTGAASAIFLWYWMLPVFGVMGGLFAVVHMAYFVSILLQLIDDVIQRRKVRRNEKDVES